MQPTVLIAVLNWGLGHATRSIPIIDAFLSQKYIVHIASDGEALTFLQKEYPDLAFHILPGYGIQYTHDSILLNVLKSSITIFRAIFNERKAINSLINEIAPNLIVSDNRYGVRSKKVKSVLITHQLNIRLNNIFLSAIGSGFIKFLIREFDEIWIPDNNGADSLSGDLSANCIGCNVKYIGPISRFSIDKLTKRYDIAVVLSGPEPQRTKFEKKVLEQLKGLGQKAIVIRGKVDEDDNYFLNENVEVKSHLLSKELNKVINQSEIVLSRSGYTTIMDLAVLGKKAVFVPTPGQTEQEYLADYLKKKKFYYSCSQDMFDIQSVLEKSRGYDGVAIEMKDLREIISKV